MTPEDRLAKLRADSKDSWISQEQFKCKCGFKSRYLCNYKKHIKECVEHKFSDGKSED